MSFFFRTAITLEGLRLHKRDALALAENGNLSEEVAFGQGVQHSLLICSYYKNPPLHDEVHLVSYISLVDDEVSG